MSHISTYTVKIKNLDLFLNCAVTRGHKILKGQQVVKQFGSNQVDAIASVKLEGWGYPLAITETGEIKYDHFGSMPNTMERLGELCQFYNEEVISMNIDYSKVQNFFKEKDKEGNVKLVFEY